MKLAIKFSFIDTIVMGNILEWDSRLKRATVCKLFKFSTPSEILDIIIKERAYLNLKEGFYNLSISKEHRMGFDLKVLGNGSYCICVYEPRLGHPGAIDYSLKYHFAFIGEKEVFEKHIVCCEKPYTVLFNEFTNRDLFKEGVTLHFLAEEGKQSSSVVSYLRQLVKDRTTTADTKLASDEPEALELTSQTMEESKDDDEDDDKSVTLSCKLVESDVENRIHHDQSLQRCVIRSPAVLQQYIQLLGQTSIQFEDWMGKAIDHLKAVKDIPALPGLNGFTMQTGGSWAMFELRFENKFTHEEIMSSVGTLFKTFFSKYTGVVNVANDNKQRFFFDLYDEDRQPLKIVMCLLRLRLWLEHYQLPHYNNRLNHIPKTVEEVKQSTPTTSSWEQKYGEQNMEPKEAHQTLTSACRAATAAANAHLEKHLSEEPVKVIPQVEPSTAIVKVIKELVDRFRDNFNFTPDAYTLSQLLCKGVERDKRDLEAFDKMTYRDLYCLSKVMEMDNVEAHIFNDFIGQLLRYMEAEDA